MKLKLSLLFLLCVSSHHAFSNEAQTTYYTWTDNTGVIQITTTPPPENVTLHATKQFNNQINQPPQDVIKPQKTQHDSGNERAVKLDVLRKQLTMIKKRTRPQSKPVKQAPSEYQRYKNRLRQRCNHHKAGSIKERECRSRAQRYFSEMCHTQNIKMPKAKRSAFCSLKETYHIIN